MDPVRSNSTGNTCPDPTGSNCVTWQGPAIPGVCRGASITDVINALSSQVTEFSQCCVGDFPAGHASCYTGAWVNFSSSIPLSGGSGSCTWTINLSISNFGPPQYRWTKDGDLKLRGGFQIHILPSSTLGSFSLTMVTVPITCLPAGYNSESQFNMTIGDPLSSSGNSTNVLLGGVSFDPSGAISLGASFSNLTLTPITADISLGGTTFNLA